MLKYRIYIGVSRVFFNAVVDVDRAVRYRDLQLCMYLVIYHTIFSNLPKLE